MVSELLSVPTDAVVFLKTATPNTPNGRYDFGDTCYVNVMDCDTKEPTDDSLMETHERYVDVQFLIDGEEKFLCADKNGLMLAVAYNPQKDIAFYRFEHAVEVVCHTGEAIVLDTCDAHLPGCAVDGAKTVKKAVMKVLKN